MHTFDPPRLAQVFYISRSLATPAEVESILEGARRQNRQRGVTGSLLFTGAHFAQVLEGTAPALADTMAVITADRRHEGVKCLIEGELAQRRFEAWSMAFAEAPGADDLVEHLLSLPQVPAERAERLLDLMFKTPTSA
ncbi:BLUF domain-containing protein [Sphaerotilaceae bacterium SBD11-9]